MFVFHLQVDVISPLLLNASLLAHLRRVFAMMHYINWHLHLHYWRLITVNYFAGHWTCWQLITTESFQFWWLC